MAALKPNEVLELPLFKNEAPHIHSISHAQFVYELCVASQREPISLRARAIDTAFSWAHTPQGYEFWSKLCTEALINRRKHNAQPQA